MKKAAKKPLAVTTTHRKDAPPWMRGDRYIQTGYRLPLGSVHGCARSLLYLHNEWVNVWSHLLPGAVHSLLLAKEYRDVSQQWKEARPMDQMIVWQYIVSCILCLLFSAGFHTLTAHSQHMAIRWLKIDYLGIILNTAAGCIASTYFGLRHHPNLQWAYSMFSIVLALILFMILLAPGADGDSMALWRAILFASFVASGFLPMIHGCMLEGKEILGLFPLSHAIGMEAFYLTGVIFYITRYPEKYYPEKFDIWGSSHQIFHILVVMGQLVFIAGLKQMAQSFGPVSSHIALQPAFGNGNYDYNVMANFCLVDPLGESI